MKKSFLLSIALLLFSVTVVDAQASISPVVSKKTVFDTQIMDISNSSDANKVQFSVGVNNITNPNNIAYWKVRSYCDDKMTIQLSASSTNDCGKAVKLNSLKNNSFSFLFKNKTSQNKNFAIKLKAYDINGKWLHTEREGFSWK